MIIAHELEKKYGQHTALDNVSVRVEAGSIVGFVGPNGAGKSTTLRIIAGLESADSGTSEIDGERSGRLSSPWSKMGTLLDRQGVNGEGGEGSGRGIRSAVERDGGDSRHG